MDVGGVERWTVAAAAAAVLLSASRLAADEVELLSGIRLQGKVLHERAEDLVVEMGEGESRHEVTISWEKVHAVTIGGQRRVVREKTPAPVPLPRTDMPGPSSDAGIPRDPTGAPPPGSTAGDPDFERPAAAETLKFLQSLPKMKFKDGRPAGQWWQDATVDDIRTLKTIHPGCHVNRDGEPPRHLRLKPGDWRFFTALEQLEAFEMTHDLEGVDDACLFYLGKLPQTMRRIQLEMSEAAGEGVTHLANLKNLRSLSLNFSRTVTDVALVHAAEISSLEYLDVNGCPMITGSGVAALAGLKNLKVLKIGGCSLSDASLQYFRDLSIEELDLSDNVAEWVVRYRGGGQHRFTVTFSGLKALLTDRANLPNLKRLIARKGPRSLLRGEMLTGAQKAELARLRPGLQVR